MNNLDKMIHELNKKYKSNIIKRGAELEHIARIPFSSPRVNYMTYGGIPRGKSTEIFGAENGGKTTLALDLVAQAQTLAYSEFEAKVEELEDAIAEAESSGGRTSDKKVKELKASLADLEETGPQKVVYVDAENTLDNDWAESLGVDTEEMILIKPENQSAEQVLQIMLDIVQSGDVILMVLDSIPMLVPQVVYEETLEKKSYGGVSAPLSQFSARVSPMLSKTNTTLIGINQMREDMDSSYVQYKTPGGRAWKHLHIVRLLVRKGDYIDEDNQSLKRSASEPAGNLIDIKIEKTKAFKPNRKVGFCTLNYTNGIDVLSDTIDVAIWNDLIMQGGSWFSLVDPSTGEVKSKDGSELKFQGKSKLLNYFRENPQAFEEIKSEVNAIVSK